MARHAAVSTRPSPSRHSDPRNETLSEKLDRRVLQTLRELASEKGSKEEEDDAADYYAALLHIDPLKK